MAASREIAEKSEAAFPFWENRQTLVAGGQSRTTAKATADCADQRGLVFVVCASLSRPAGSLRAGSFGLAQDFGCPRRPGTRKSPTFAKRRQIWATGYVGHQPAGIFYVRFGLAAYAQAFGRVEWVLSFTLPSDESLGFLLPSRGAGLAPRLAQKKGEPFDKLRASSGAPGNPAPG